MRGQGWTGAQQRGRRTPAPSPSNSPTAQPPVPLGPGFTHPPRLCQGVGGAGAHRGYHVPVSGTGAQRGGCSSPPRPPAVAPRGHRYPKPRRPPRLSSLEPRGPLPLRSRRGRGKRAPAGGMVTCVPRAIPTPSPSLGRGKAAGKNKPTAAGGETEARPCRVPGIEPGRRGGSGFVAANSSAPARGRPAVTQESWRGWRGKGGCRHGWWNRPGSSGQRQSTSVRPVGWDRVHPVG